MITRDNHGNEKEWFFNHESIYADSTVFKAWETGRIDSATASSRLAKNNHWDSAPNQKEFQQLANGLGYTRMPDEFYKKHFGY